MIGFSDADCGDDNNDYKSTSGYFFPIIIKYRFVREEVTNCKYCTTNAWK